jgi:hypothetical protein
MVGSDVWVGHESTYYQHWRCILVNWDKRNLYYPSHWNLSIIRSFIAEYDIFLFPCCINNSTSWNNNLTSINNYICYFLVENTSWVCYVELYSYDTMSNCYDVMMIVVTINHDHIFAARLIITIMHFIRLISLLIASHIIWYSLNGSSPWIAKCCCSTNKRMCPRLIIRYNVLIHVSLHRHYHCRWLKVIANVRCIVVIFLLWAIVLCPHARLL